MSTGIAQPASLSTLLYWVGSFGFLLGETFLGVSCLGLRGGSGVASLFTFWAGSALTLVSWDRFGVP